MEKKEAFGNDLPALPFFFFTLPSLPNTVYGVLYWCTLLVNVYSYVVTWVL